MRPVRIELQNFMCYRGDIDIDFANGVGDLFAITGETGSGKSTILDAITYALYGQTARLGSRGMDALIPPEADTAVVRVTFEASQGDLYRVTRSAARKKSTATEVRVEKRHVEKWRQLTDSEKVRDANAVIQAILGLDYDGFTRAILLPQGQFDEFLRGDTAKRRRLLSTLLDLDIIEEIRGKAHEKARNAEVLADSTETRIREDYSDATEGNLAIVRIKARQAKGRLREAEEAVAKAQDVKSFADKELQRRNAELEPLMKEVRKRNLQAAYPPDSFPGEYDPDIWDVIDAHQSALTRLRDIRDRVNELWIAKEAADKRLEQGREAVAAAEKDLLTPEKLEAARSQLVDAEVAYDNARRANLVGALVEGLSEGDPCPVCGKPLDDHPDTHDGSALALARRDLELARTALATLEADQKTREQRLAVAKANLNAREENSQRATKQFQEAEARFDAAKTHSVVANLDAFERQVNAERAEQEDRCRWHLKVHTEDLPKVEEAVAASARVLARAEADLDRWQVEAALKEEEEQRIQERLEKAAALQKELEEARATNALYRELAYDLRGNNFPEYILARSQADLVATASRIMRDLTGARFDLDLVDGDYIVTDSWLGGARSARTLSGGETFIASLSLALALSESIAGKRLGALFLDEGFGSLDADTLDAVTSMLEGLTTHGRMVGVVTHVRSLTERLPARLVVTKGREGSKVEWDA